MMSVYVILLPVAYIIPTIQCIIGMNHLKSVGQFVRKKNTKHMVAWLWSILSLNGLEGVISLGWEWSSGGDK